MENPSCTAVHSCAVVVGYGAALEGRGSRRASTVTTPDRLARQRAAPRVGEAREVGRHYAAGDQRGWGGSACPRCFCLNWNLSRVGSISGTTAQLSSHGNACEALPGARRRRRTRSCPRATPRRTATAAPAAPRKSPRTRGLHSFTSQLNVSAFCGIGVCVEGLSRGYVGVVRGCSGLVRACL
jgi:hypothetical protein